MGMTVSLLQQRAHPVSFSHTLSPWKQLRAAGEQLRAAAAAAAAAHSDVAKLLIQEILAVKIREVQYA